MDQPASSSAKTLYNVPSTASSDYSESMSDSSTTTATGTAGDSNIFHLQRADRYLMSTSLDVDLRLPYRSELRGLSPALENAMARPLLQSLKHTSAQDHQTLLVTSMLMGHTDHAQGGGEGSRCTYTLIHIHVLTDTLIHTRSYMHTFSYTHSHTSPFMHTLTHVSMHPTNTSSMYLLHYTAL